MACFLKLVPDGIGVCSSTPFNVSFTCCTRKLRFFLANFADLAAAWENVGEVKSAVSEI